ncbi:nucleolar RNA helicase 2-like [Mytilus edulis]|uniref:nucleolar RNA helicase 2-like n=1 Tax=Mytilus edulis TaxID=6550 RepID=UPI0039F03DE5
MKLTEEETTTMKTETVKKEKKIKEKTKVKKEKKSKKTDKATNGLEELAPSNDSTEDQTKADDTTAEKELTPDEKNGAFSNFNISQQSLKKLSERGVTYLFPIQAKTYNIVYEGKNLIAQARTGTGKTLSFALPLVEILQKCDKTKKTARAPKVLVMAPTRELAKQVCEDFSSVSTNLSAFCIYGGSPYAPQEYALRTGIDILVGTPGRIYDHIERGNLDLTKLQHVVLDEVDQMLDMGFADMVDSILQHAYGAEIEKKPQTLLFSATLPPWVQQTGKKYFGNNVEKIVLVGSMENRTSKNVEHLAIKCSYFDRASTIGDVIKVYSGNHGRTMVFCQTKRDADELAVSPSIKQDCEVLHGDIPQMKRERVLKSFREGKCKVLISTDVAARGLDIPEIDLVIQCSPPKDVESYIHRSGRTGRAGRSGICLCFYKPQEEYDIQTVERRANIKFKKIGGPTTEDIIKASAADAARSLELVEDETLQYFRESAQALVEERGAVDAVAAALAVISGSTKIVPRSLLSSKEGFTTYIFTTNMEMRTMSYVWRALEKQLPEEIKEKAMRMRFCKDKMSSVFDLPSEFESDVATKWTDTNFDTLQKATALPELLESESSNKGYGNSWGGGGGGGRGGGGFRGRGSRGGGGFGRGSRGGGRGMSNGFSAQKRRIDTSNGEPQNKKIRFD